jgi:hypothetical protein
MKLEERTETKKSIRIDCLRGDIRNRDLDYEAGDLSSALLSLVFQGKKSG